MEASEHWHYVSMVVKMCKLWLVIFFYGSSILCCEELGITISEIKQGIVTNRKIVFQMSLGIINVIIKVNQYQTNFEYLTNAFLAKSQFIQNLIVKSTLPFSRTFNFPGNKFPIFPIPEISYYQRTF